MLREHEKHGVSPIVWSLRAAEFVSGAPDDEIQSDVVGFIGQLLQHVKAQK
jgi:hypothetical protein